jgi:hypothetical protein
VANNQEYIERVKMAVEHLHNCRAIHCATVPVHEVFQGKTVWQGDVEVFDLTGHPKAKRAYAWSHCDGKEDQDERFVAVLELPPVDSAQSAVKVAIVAESKKRKQGL